MLQRIITCLLAVMLLFSVTIPAFATETADPTEETTQETTEETKESARRAMDTSGSCGDNTTWQLVDDHTLIISGSGAIDAGAPWEFYKDTIYTLILDGEITSIGDKSFYSFNNLKYIDFGPALKEIGTQAFYSCNALEAIRLPATFRKFGQECFMDCDGLQVIFFDGPMPSFKANCLYTNHTVQLIYTLENPWPESEIDRLRSNFGARLYMDVGTADVLNDYLTGSNISDYDNWSAEPAPVETQPEPTVPETTVPETTVPEFTLPPLPEATVPEPLYAPEEITGEHVTEPLQTTQPSAPTQAQPVMASEASADPIPQNSSITMVLWMIIAAAVLTGILIIVLLIRMIIHSSGRYDD